jgi:hypothetical protein
MIEVQYRKPADPDRERAIWACVSNYDGEVMYREDDSTESICLTVEFPSWETAQDASSKLRESGEHVEGPMDYGID